MSTNVPEEALRLVLTYRGEQIHLDDVIRVAMRLMPSDSLEDWSVEPSTGFWYELQNSEGQPLYRRVTRHPLRMWVDLPDENDPDRLLHVESEMHPDETTFVIDVPAMPEGDRVVLFSGPLDRLWEALPAEPIWRISLPHG